MNYADYYNDEGDWAPAREQGRGRGRGFGSKGRGGGYSRAVDTFQDIGSYEDSNIVQEDGFGRGRGILAFHL